MAATFFGSWSFTWTFISWPLEASTMSPPSSTVVKPALPERTRHIHLVIRGAETMIGDDDDVGALRETQRGELHQELADLGIVVANPRPRPAGIPGHDHVVSDRAPSSMR